MFSRIEAKTSELIFLCRNWLRMRKSIEFSTLHLDNITYSGFTQAEADQVSAIYYRLNGGARFSFSREMLYRTLGERLLLLASHDTKTGKTVIGMNMYYLNSRDLRENTIHEGFIGVLPEAAGKGIATQMRKIAKAHFASSGINGISTRISLNNLASLRSAKKIGFKPVEQYRDPQTNEERYYMICNLQKTSKEND